MPNTESVSKAERSFTSFASLRQCLVLVVVLAVVGCVEKSEMGSWSSALPFQVKKIVRKNFQLADGLKNIFADFFGSVCVLCLGDDNWWKKSEMSLAPAALLPSSNGHGPHNRPRAQGVHSA